MLLLICILYLIGDRETLPEDIMRKKITSSTNNGKECGWKMIAITTRMRK